MWDIRPAAKRGAGYGRVTHQRPLMDQEKELKARMAVS